MAFKLQVLYSPLLLDMEQIVVSIATRDLSPRPKAVIASLKDQSVIE